jgi:putative ATPase
VYVLEPLSADELGTLIERACAKELGGLVVEDAARQMLIDAADGDARRLLNALEVAAHGAHERGLVTVTAEYLRETLPATLRRFDKGGENFYDQISALHKAVRGSDPDAGLYWMARMFDGGVDPRYVARRVVRMATEDVGLADPRALEIALAASETYERLGSPEGELAIAQAVVYMACAPKSNALYKAYGDVRAFIAKDATRPVPMRLRNAPTRLMKDLGYGEGYRYAHDEPDAYAAGETYLPDGMKPVRWYEPTEQGVEQRIRERLQYLRGLDRQSKGPDKS